MAFSSEGTAHNPNQTFVAQKLEQSRRDVLDLTLRNSLLNFRPSKRWGIEVVDELSPEIFRILVERQRVMYFLPAPEVKSKEETGDEDEDFPSELLTLLAEPEVESDGPADRHVDNKLQTTLVRATLNRRLRETFRQARSSIEEQGVNTLYLALGLLRWYESEKSELERIAPLILIPVRLDRTDVRHSFKLSWTEDEIEANLSLEAKLKNDFDVRLPEMPREDDLDISKYFEQVADAVGRLQRWSVDENAIRLGFFSFSKFLIYKDLDSSQWPDEAQPADHPVVRALYDSEGFGSETSAIGDEEHIDDHPSTADLLQVVDADSSQTLAVVDAVDGQNLVIQGPPGTGKSQTITNLLAEALARGKKILFVSEKMAALEVVKRRLDTIHLGDTCLELHSHNTNKRAVLTELKRTLELGRPVNGTDVDNEVLKLRRQQLNEYAVAANTPFRTSGFTPHQLVGKLEELRASGISVDDLGIRCQGAVSWSRADFNRHRAVVEDIQSLVSRMGPPQEHLFWAAGLLQIPLPTDERRIRQALEVAGEALRNVRSQLNRLQTLVLPAPKTEDESLQDAQLSVHMAERVAEASELIAVNHRNPAWVTQSSALEELAKQAVRYAELRTRHDSVLIPEAWEIDVMSIRQALIAYGEKWWRFASGDWRRAMAALRGLCRTDPPKEVANCLKLVDDVLEAGRLRRTIAESYGLTTALFPGMILSDSPQPYCDFARATTWFADLHAEKKAGEVDETIHDMLDHQPAKSEVQHQSQVCQEAMQRVQDALDDVSAVIELRADRLTQDTGLSEILCEELGRWLESAAAHMPSLGEVVRFNQFAQKAHDSGIGEVTEVAASHADAAEQLLALFEQGCYSIWLEAALKERPALAQFDGDTQEDVAAQFRRLDTTRLESNRVHIAHSHWLALPRHHGGGQLGILRREFEKKRRHLPVRTLMSQAGNAIQSIKPVFMMSPLSIAKYVPPGALSFDIVVFDEASQVRPVEAIGAILRGTQSVVVGDSRQLPPTAFFDRAGSDTDEEQSDTADLESILGLFCAQGAPERWLRWHYRSRHESLITVSNHEFYDDRLIVFPSPDAGKQESGLSFQHDPNNLYDRNGVNVAEARKVAAAVMEHARNHPNLTLGAVAFNLKQARRIEDELEILRRRNPSLEASFFTQHSNEPFFVKNLENVQGDERDVILISVGYGKLDGGLLPMNFGPLNRDGGERRLNVLITRARRRCVVHSNFLSADLDLRRSKARGIQALKTFLKYAEKGILDVPQASGREADSPFEEAVASALRTEGHQIEQQVGSAGFFIDLAVVDPDRPGRYMLGIECDGAKYHSARSARDRDRLRQQVLEGLGWSIHRVWSTDWFRNRERELDRIQEAIQTANSGGGGRPSGDEEFKAEPLTRSSMSVGAADNRATPYIVARPRIELQAKPLHEVYLPQLAEWMSEVIQIESPIHRQEVVTRVRTAAGVRRAGSRIQQHMKLGIRVGVRSKLFDQRGDFLWRPGHTIPDVRSRDGILPDTAKALRSIEMIAPEEITQALHHAVNDSFGIGEDEAINEACRLFGFQRTGSKITSRIRPIVEQMLKDGKLQRTGGLLCIP